MILRLITGSSGEYTRSRCHCGFQIAVISLAMSFILFTITFVDTEVHERVSLCSPYCPFLFGSLLHVTCGLVKVLFAANMKPGSSRKFVVSAGQVFLSVYLKVATKLWISSALVFDSCYVPSILLVKGTVAAPGGSVVFSVPL